jgi:hypothetical protein
MNVYYLQVMGFLILNPINGNLLVLYCIEVQIDSDLNFAPLKFIVAELTMGAYTVPAICCTSIQKLT